jgi:hypothetical protein
VSGPAIAAATAVLTSNDRSLSSNPNANDTIKARKLINSHAVSLAVQEDRTVTRLTLQNTKILHVMTATHSATTDQFNGSRLRDALVRYARALVQSAVSER